MNNNQNHHNYNPPSTRSSQSAGSTGAPRIYFKNALATVPVPDKLLKGVSIVKVEANGKSQEANLSISQDKFTIYIKSLEGHGVFGFFSSRKTDSAERAVDIGEIDRLQRGQSTQQFEMAKKNVDRMEAAVLRKTELNRNTSAGSSTQQSNNQGSQPQTPLQLSLSSLDPQRSFSIIFRGAHTLDLMTESADDRNIICDTLDRILLAYQRAKIRVANDVLLLRYIWLDVDKDKTGFSNVHQIGKILQQINFTMRQRDLQPVYDKFGKVIGLDRTQRRRGLTFEQSATFLHKLKRDSWMVKPVNVIWNELFGEIMNNGKPRLTVSDKTFLEKFLQGKQGQIKATILDVRKLFRRLQDMEMAHTTNEPTDGNRIDKNLFEVYLLANENDAFDPDRENYDESDMNQPLSEYWINSSHNTYLIGHQITSHSSVEMYSNALYRGARCLEVDIWDGERSTNGTPVPVVWHGHTMTTKIYFVDIIKTIKVFLNFHPDTFPIVLSFENHCSIPYQEVMAEQLIRILGDLLYVPTEASLYGRLPSPAQLRGLVVIKGRRPIGTEADAYDTDDDSDGEDGPTVTSSMGDLTRDGLAQEAVKKHGIAPQLARLTLFHGTKQKNWGQSVRMPTHHMHSVSENKVRSLCRHKASHHWIVFNQSHMSRTYPGGSRVDSSNYNPLLAWSTGCQMVALNFQTEDAFLRLNDGRFRENGSCGYVLKPSSLMMKDDFSHTSDSVRLSIRVLSASCLPKPKGQRAGDCIDPYVKVSIFDVKNEEKETITSYPTSVVPSNGFFPIWGQEKFAFVVENWAVAVLQVTVYDKAKDDFIGSSSIPISCLRRGIRSVKLYDATNTRSGAFDFGSLLLDIKIGQVVAEI
jgi:phosphatidylinositol phospholipase C delta